MLYSNFRYKFDINYHFAIVDNLAGSVIKLVEIGIIFIKASSFFCAL
jgi:hypothetical protein